MFNGLIASYVHLNVTNARGYKVHMVNKMTETGSRVLQNKEKLQWERRGYSTKQQSIQSGWSFTTQIEGFPHVESN